MRCLEGAGHEIGVDAREIDQPGGGDELTSPYVEGEELDLRAFVVLERGKEANEDDLKAYVKKNLARFKVPREIVFLDELPRNATGKVLKRELKELESAPQSSPR